MTSRILMVFYALIGIPMNGILLAQLGEFFGQGFVTAVQKYKHFKKTQKNDYSKKTLSTLEKRRAGLAVQIFIYLLPGFIMFIFFPAFVFSYFEGWTYDVSVYYAFVTLTTIGFGDCVAGYYQKNTKFPKIFFKMSHSWLNWHFPRSGRFRKWRGLVYVVQNFFNRMDQFWLGIHRHDNDLHCKGYAQQKNRQDRAQTCHEFEAHAEQNMERI